MSSIYKVNIQLDKKNIGDLYFSDIELAERFAQGIGALTDEVTSRRIDFEIEAINVIDNKEQFLNTIKESFDMASFLFKHKN